MSYNAILQNSPALNSLKRQQLVKLCKRHALKASGKNVDLIERLKEHGTGLPPEALDYRWELSDGDDEEPNPFLSPGPAAPPQTSLSMSTRPSEQWEIVMDDIAEADENGKKTGSVLRTPGKASEFGTAGSKSATKFSLKTAITNSLGLKRSTARDTDESTDQPIPGAFDFPDSPSLEPIPGTSAKPGTPAPANARLSFSLPTTTTTTSTNNTNKQPTTTIRLIPSSSTESANLNIPTPPRIAPFKTTFDLEMTPGVGAEKRGAVWPASPVPTTQRKEGGGGGGRLYPAIPAEDLMPTPFKSNFSGVLGTPGAPTPIPALNISPAKSESSFPKPMLADDVFSPAKPSPASVLSKAAASQKKDITETKEKEGLSKPYLFGSPITQPHFEFSPGKMDAATTNVLEEMNKRLAEAGLQKVDKQSLPSVSGSGNKADAVRSNQQDRKSGGGGGERFAKAHEEVFNKMDSITNHYAARRPPPPPPPASAGKKRKSEAAGLAHAPTSRKMSVGGGGVGGGGVRKKMSVPGGLPSLDGHEDDGGEGGERREGEEGEERSGKRMRVAEDQDVHRGKQPSLSLRKKTEEERKKQEEEEMKRQKKMEATRKHLDAARRRSRSGRASLGVKGVGPSPAKKAGGLFGAAKALVRNVWNKTTTTTTTAAAAASTTTAPPKSSATTSSTIGKSTSVASKTTAASLARARSPTEVHPQPHPPTSRPSTSQSHAASTLAPRSTTSTIAPRAGSLVSRPSTLASRPSTIASRPSTVASRPSTLAPRAAPRSTSLSVKPKSRSVSSSSTGPGTAHTVRPKISLAPSVSGTARNTTSNGNAAGPSTAKAKASTHGSEDLSPRKRTAMSTLMRPTASSMAKTASGGASRVLSPSSLRQNTLSPTAQAAKMKPKAIFTKPVSRENFGGGGGGAGKDSRDQNMSLGMAGESMLKPSSVAPLKTGIPRSKVGGASSSIPRPNLKARSSMGAATPKKSSGVAMLKNSKRMGMHLKVRQSEYAGAGARRTGGGEGESEAMDVDA